MIVHSAQTHARSLAIYVVTILFLPAVAGAAQAQDKTVPSAPTCTACTIRLRPVVTLGSPGDPVDISSSSVVVQRGDGYAVAPVGDRTQVGFYGRSGSFERVAGRQGQGPGEFNNIRSLTVLSSGALAVLDNRLTILPASSAATVISRPLPAGIIAGRLMALPDGRLLVNNYRPGRQPLCVFGADLTLVRCFGEAATPARHAESALERLLAPGDRGTVWAATQSYQYMIERFDTVGRRVGRIRRDAAWFPESRAENDPGRSFTQSRPLPRLAGLWVDLRGRIWTAVLVPDPQWHATQAAQPAGREGRAAAVVPVADWSKYFDTVLEVIDPAAGRVVASERFPGVLGGFSRDGLLIELRETSDGLLQAVVLRPQIVQPASRY